MALKHFCSCFANTCNHGLNAKVRDRVRDRIIFSVSLLHYTIAHLGQRTFRIAALQSSGPESRVALCAAAVLQYFVYALQHLCFVR